MLMRQFGVQPEAGAPFAEGVKGMFDEPVLKTIAAKYGKSPAQVILRWNIQQGVIVIPKSVHVQRMKENLAIWDFALDEEDLRNIAALDKHCPSMLDTRKPSEVKRVYDYLKMDVTACFVLPDRMWNSETTLHDCESADDTCAGGT